MPIIKNLKLRLDDEWLVSHVEKDNIPLVGTQTHGDRDIVDEQGKHISSIKEVIDSFLKQSSCEDGCFTKDFEDSFIDYNGQLLKLKSLYGEYEFHVSSDVININIENIVHMILKDTLNGTFRRIDEYGNLI